MKKPRFGRLYIKQGGSTVPVVIGKDRQLYPYVVLDAPLAQKYAGLHLIEGDLEFAMAAMTQCRQMPITHKTSTTGKSLWLSALVTYAKCYTSSRGRNVNLNAKDCFRSATKQQRECHEDMLRTRNVYVAHAGQCEEQRGKVLLVLHPDPSKKAVVTFAALSLSAVSVDAKYLDRCIEVMRIVLAYVKDASKKAEAALRKAIDAEPLNKWYSQAVVPRVQNASITLFPKHYVETDE